MGTSGKVRTCVELMMFFLLTGISGNEVISDIEAMKMFFIVIISSKSSTFVTVTLLGSEIVSLPRTQFSLFYLKRYTMPPLRAFKTLVG